VVIASLKLIF